MLILLNVCFVKYEGENIINDWKCFLFVKGIKVFYWYWKFLDEEYCIV